MGGMMEKMEEVEENWEKGWMRIGGNRGNLFGEKVRGGR